MAANDLLSAATLGYQVHTNRELGMMLHGTKPLAIFVDDYGEFPEGVRRYLRSFDRHVAAGRFEKREYVDLRTRGAKEIRRVHVILYALPGESWRIDAMIELHGQLSHWSSEAERREGELLGYEDWQNDLWMRDRFGRS